MPAMGRHAKAGPYTLYQYHCALGQIFHWILLEVLSRQKQNMRFFLFIVDMFPKMAHFVPCKKAILAGVDMFLKMEHFVPCKKATYAPHLSELFFKNIVHLHDIP